MSYIYLQEQGEESSAACYSDIPQYVLSKLKNIQGKSYCSDNETESCQNFQSGTTSALLTENHGEGKSMSCVEDSHAKTLVQQEKEQALMETEAECGDTWQELSVKYDRDSCSWKTHRCLWDEDLPESSVILPRCGIARNGVCSELAISELGICVKGSGWWLPTICKNESKGAGRNRWRGSQDYRGAKMSEGLRTCREDPIYLTASFGEVAMGFPLTWTELQPLETHNFRKWLRQHSEFYQKD